jgi:hypothetical protein
MNPAKPAVSVPEVLGWALLAFLGAFAMLVFRPSPLFDDSYQYLNVAEHIQREHQIATSLIHFDTERSHGRMPAPLTTFPPGFPMMISLTSIGGDFEGAARFLSCISYACTAALLAWALMLTGVTVFVRQAVLLLFATNAIALTYATSVLSDPLFLLVSTGAIVALMWAEESNASKKAVIARAVVAMTAAGLAYLVRYAGLFLITAFIGYALVRMILPGSRYRGVFLVAGLIPVAIAGVTMARNIVIARTWKGGNEIPIHNPVRRVLVDYARAQLHVLIGQHAFVFGVWEAFLLVGAFAIIGTLLAAVRKNGGSDSAGPSAKRATLLAALGVAAYTAGLVYACLTTVLVFEIRYLLPTLPLYLLLLAIGTNGVMSRSGTGPQRALKAGLVLAVVGYAGVNARDLYLRAAPVRLKILAAEFGEPDLAGRPLDVAGRPLKDWVETHIPANETVIAADGQATGYLLHRPTISMVSAEHSAARWECDDVKNQMRRFHASFVILPKASPSIDEDALLAESGFVSAALSAQPPCGFAVAAENADIRILTTAE